MDKSQIKRLVRQALREDLPRRDITTDSFVPKDARTQAQIFLKETAVVCGVALAKRVFLDLDPNIQVKIHVRDGQKVPANTTVITAKGHARTILSAERTALNFLSYLSAVATQTRAFVERVRPYKVQILDTRKTTPTLRFLERYAVRCGGGVNHRDNLSNAIMIKDNHWLSMDLSNVNKKIAQIKKASKIPVIIEVDRLSQLTQMFTSQADIILLDNMSPTTIRKAVAMRHKARSKVLFEVSGGITLKNVKGYAKTGIERISIGALTHSRKAVDYSLELFQK